MNPKIVKFLHACQNKTILGLIDRIFAMQTIPMKRSYIGLALVTTAAAIFTCNSFVLSLCLNCKWLKKVCGSSKCMLTVHHRVQLAF